MVRLLSTPFPTPLLASQALQILSPDKELKEDLVRRTLSVQQAELRIEFECVSALMTRIAVNAFLESIELVLNSMAELGEYMNVATN
jgi:Transcription factor Pcc1